MPALVALAYLPLLLQLRHHAVEIVRRNTHLLGQLGDGDSGIPLNQPLGLGGTGSAPGSPAAPTAAPVGRTAARSARPGGSLSTIRQGRERGLQTPDLVTQIGQP